MNLDFEQLYERAKWAGTELGPGLKPLSRAEIDAVAMELQELEPEAEPYVLLLTLGRAFATDHRELVESFLVSPEDPMLARAALSVLCDAWDMASEYVTVVAAFIEGVGWDEEGQVRGMALSKAGEYLRDHDDAELLGLLLSAFDDPDEDPVSKQGVYFALARAVGRDWNEIPSAADELDFESDVDPLVLDEARERLQRLGGGEPGPSQGGWPSPAPPWVPSEPPRE